MLFSSKLPRRTTWNVHQGGVPVLRTEVSHKLHAQRKALQLIIGVVVRVFVKSQRRDAYYRNDPSKYGLTENWSSSIIYQQMIEKYLWLHGITAIIAAVIEQYTNWSIIWRQMLHIHIFGWHADDCLLEYYGSRRTLQTLHSRRYFTTSSGILGKVFN